MKEFCCEDLILMKRLEILINPEVEAIFNNYPDSVREKLLSLRRLIIESANESKGINKLEETLKWGEPSYLTKIGSTIRIDWKEKKPEQYAIYFKCTTKLVPTFKTVYPELFKYEDNRAIIFQLNDVIPEDELKKCIATALSYHKVKQLPMLGL